MEIHAVQVGVQHQQALALALIVASNYFFGTGENLIAAFLPELADSRAMGRVSGWGWAFGYLGGLAAAPSNP